MTAANGKSRVDDLKRVGIIISITLGLGALAGGIFAAAAWASGMQTKALAEAQHEKIVQQVYTRTSKADFAEHKRVNGEKYDALNDTLKEIKGDLKVIRQRTWELKERHE